MDREKPGVSPLLVKALALYPTRVEFGRAIGEARHTIWDWENKTGYIPAVYAIVVGGVTGICPLEIVEEAYRRRGLGRRPASKA